MTSTSYFDFSPIYALATPYGKSAIAVFRTSGDGTIENIKKVFSNNKKLESVTKTGLVYGYIIDSENGEKVDEVPSEQSIFMRQSFSIVFSPRSFLR